MAHIKSSDFVPGRIYSVVYTSTVDMVQTRNGQDNPLFDCLVTVRRVSSVQAAGEKTWRNFNLAKDSNWQPSGRKSWYTATPDNSCIVAHNKTGQKYLRCLPKNISKEEYFIGGILATDAEVQTIRAFKKNQGEADFATFRLDNLANVIDCGGEAE